MTYVNQYQELVCGWYQGFKKVLDNEELEQILPQIMPTIKN